MAHIDTQERGGDAMAMSDVDISEISALHLRAFGEEEGRHG